MKANKTAIDVEHLKQTNLYYDVFYTSPASVGIARLEDRRFVDVNDGFRRLFGYEKDEVIGRTAEELNIDVNEESSKDIFSRVRQGETIRWTETKIRTKNGKIRNVIGSYLPVEVEGTRYVATKLVDITEMRQLEKEVLKASEHEHRNLEQNLQENLSQQLTKVEMLISSIGEELEAKTPEAAKKIKEAATMLQQTNEKTQQLVSEVVPGDIAQKGLVAALEDFATHFRKTYRISCRIVGEKSLSISDSATAEQFYHIIRKAATNAAKRSKANLVLIRLIENENQTVVKVIDNGDKVSEEAFENRRLSLRTLEYRARMMGIRLDIQRGQNGGTVVTCVLDKSR